MGSRGSVIPIFLDQNKNLSAPFTVTDKNMTRFNISLNEATRYVLNKINTNNLNGLLTFLPTQENDQFLNLQEKQYDPILNARKFTI